MPPLPRSITDPPSTIHRSDLFFGAQAAPHPPARPRHTQSFTASQISHSDSLSRSRTVPPPMPPPPPVPRSLVPARMDRLPGTPAVQTPMAGPSTPIYEAQFQAALKMSRTESENHTLDIEKQEEEELARALKESLRTSNPPTPYIQPASTSYGHPQTNYSSYSRSPPAGSPPVPSSPTSRRSFMSSTDSSRTDSTSTMSSSLFSSATSSTSRSSHAPYSAGMNVMNSGVHDDEAFARKLAMEEEAGIRWSQSQKTNTTVEDDEAFARRIAAEENEELKEEGSSSEAAFPPAYDDAISPRPTPRPLTSDAINARPMPTPNPIRASLPAPVSSASEPQPQSHPSLSPMAPLAPVRHTVSDTNIASANGAGNTRPIASSSPPSSQPPTTTSSPEVPSINPNQFLDTELLQGVSIGWSTPTIGPQLPSMKGPMPNVISLPYGRCPPLHFQAPNWRHLLMLMARLPGTRVEPTVEAMSQNKFDMKLRTVIQFVRPHHSSNDWRTVIWLTIDTPVPPGPQNRRYTINDVDVLPFSYSFSPIPTLLQNNPDTPLSKVFTVPATDSKPFPILPITFPNLALYLQAALDESRRLMGDSSGGVRKLAKMVQLCYPGLYEFDTNESGSVGNFFRKFGRGNKNNKRGGRGGNEDVYELVTPFVAEWG